MKETKVKNIGSFFAAQNENGECSQEEVSNAQKLVEVALTFIRQLQLFQMSSRYITEDELDLTFLSNFGTESKPDNRQKSHMDFCKKCQFVSLHFFIHKLCTNEFITSVFKFFCSFHQMSEI